MRASKKVLFTSVITIALSVAFIGGYTVALFTSDNKLSSSLTSANVEIFSNAHLAKAWSAKWEEDHYEYPALAIANEQATFLSKGTVTNQNGKVKLTHIAPGDGVEIALDLYNHSNIDVKFRFVVSEIDPSNEEDEVHLFNALKIDYGVNAEYQYNANGIAYPFEEVEDGWYKVKAYGSAQYTGANYPLYLRIELPLDTTDTYQNLSCELQIVVQAVQPNDYLD